MIATKQKCCRLAGGGACLILACGLLAQSRLIQVPLTSDADHFAAPARTIRDDQAITGPVLGFVPDGQTGLRQLLGVPGAVTWGRTIPLPKSDILATSAELSYALLATAEDGDLLVVSDLQGGGTYSLVHGVIGKGFDQAATSPGGTTVALYDSQSGMLQVLEGLPESPVPGWSSNLGTVPGALKALAVSDDGQAVLVIAGGEEQSILAILAPDSSWRALTALRGQASVSFMRNSRNALLSENQTNQISLIRDVTGAASTTILAGEIQGISTPVAVAASRDNRRVIVTNSLPDAVIVIPVDGAKATAFSCACSPVGLQRLNGNAVFLLNDPSDHMLWLVDADSAVPRIVSVPPESDVAPERFRRGSRGGTRARGHR